MKRSGFKTKSRKPLRRTSLKRGASPSLKKTKLRKKGKSEVSTTKDKIQDVLRDIVILRDGGCIARDQEWHENCGGYTKDGKLVLQADHLIEKSNSETYAMIPLVICVCKGLHGWKHFKKSNHDLYNQRMKELLPESTIKLWEKMEADSWRPKKVGAYDWNLKLAELEQILKEMQGDINS